jgi:nitroreductase
MQTNVLQQNKSLRFEESEKMISPVLKAIYIRRSIREFTDAEISIEQLHQIIKAGMWAPSGLNNQPWRFAIIKDSGVKEQVSQQTHYGHIVRGANALIAVYLSKDDMYDAVKDHQAAGACIQNMLLATEAMGLGAVWLGQILKNKSEVNRILGLADNFDLMAVVALGYPLHHNQKSRRKEMSELLIKQV